MDWIFSFFFFFSSLFIYFFLDNHLLTTFAYNDHLVWYILNWLIPYTVGEFTTNRHTFMIYQHQFEPILSGGQLTKRPVSTTCRFSFKTRLMFGNLSKYGNGLLSNLLFFLCPGIWNVFKKKYLLFGQVCLRVGNLWIRNRMDLLFQSMSTTLDIINRNFVVERISFIFSAFCLLQKHEQHIFICGISLLFRWKFPSI